MKLWKKILVALIIGLVFTLIANYIPRNHAQSYLLGGGKTTQYGIPLISRTEVDNATLVPAEHNSTFSTVPLIINFSIIFMLVFGAILVFSKFNHK